MDTTTLVEPPTSPFCVVMSGLWRTFFKFRHLGQQTFQERFEQTVMRPNGFPDLFLFPVMVDASQFFLHGTQPHDRDGLERLKPSQRVKMVHTIEWSHEYEEQLKSQFVTWPPMKRGSARQINVVAMFAHLYKADRVMRQYAALFGFEYQIIMRHRPDEWFVDWFRLPFAEHASTMFENAREHTVIVPTGCDSGGLCDQIALASWEGMRRYTSTWKQMTDMIASNYPDSFWPERFNLVHAQNQELGLARFETLIYGQSFWLASIIECDGAAEEC